MREHKLKGITPTGLRKRSPKCAPLPRDTVLRYAEGGGFERLPRIHGCACFANRSVALSRIPKAPRPLLRSRLGWNNCPAGYRTGTRSGPDGAVRLGWGLSVVPAVSHRATVRAWRRLRIEASCRNGGTLRGAATPWGPWSATRCPHRLRRAFLQNRRATS